MNKLSLRLNLGKIDKTKITPRSYTNQAGVEITEQNYDIEICPLKVEKLIKEGDTWALWKVGFATEKSTKNADGSYNNGNILGDVTEMRNKQTSESVIPSVEGAGYTGEVAKTDDIPF